MHHAVSHMTEISERGIEALVPDTILEYGG